MKEEVKIKVMSEIPLIIETHALIDKDRNLKY